MSENSYVFISGATSGMGEATALLLKDKYNLILHGRELSKLESIANRCATTNHKIRVFNYDFSDVSNLRLDLSSWLQDSNLKVDSFIHFAGLPEIVPISRSSYKLGLKVMNVNYFAATEIIGTLTKKTINDNYLEKVILISSIVVEGGMKYQPHYCASKGALDALTRALACELAPQTRVNCISPGSFNTEMTKNLFSDLNKERPPDTLLKNQDCNAVANTVEFLLSNSGSYLTGVNIPVDGGERLLGKLTGIKVLKDNWL